MLALARDPKSSFLEGSHGIQMIDAWNLGQGLHRDFDFANFFALELFFNYREVLLDRVPNILQSLRFRGPLGPAARQARDGNAVAFVGLVNCDFVFHTTSAHSIARPPPRRRTAAAK